MRVHSIARAAIAFLVAATPAQSQTPPSDIIQFVFTADLHYGIARQSFRGRAHVDAALVSAALVEQINALPHLTLPADSGVRAGGRVGSVDIVVVAGDIANLEGNGVQSATESWHQFQADFVHGLSVRDRTDRPAKLFLLPGNHDLSNAVGSTRPLTPAHDAAAMAGIYDLMLRPRVLITAETFDRRRDVVHYSRDVGGVHMAFVSIWPDSSERVWLALDLRAVPQSTPVLLFAHDPPIADPKHFTNPNGAHDINAVDRFENLVFESYKDGTTTDATDPLTGELTRGTTTIEQRGLAEFVKAHPNIKAYFHGHSNANEFYVWRGPDADLALNTFRVDSPMKGAVSANDESQLSFQLVTIDTRTLTMTVREVLWNAEGAGRIRFQSSRTVVLR